MPLLKTGRAWRPAAVPKLAGRVDADSDSDVDPADPPVFRLRFTGEIFLTFQEYTKTLLKYKSPTWACQATGTSGLTFEQALKSEDAVRADLLERFPACWMRPVLQILEFNQNKLDDVVTLIIQEIENNAFPQELVQVRLEGYPIKHAVVRDSKQSGKITLFAVFISDLNLVMDLPLEFLMRDKKSLAKNLVKKLVRAFAFQDSIWPGSPWVVNEYIANQYGIDKEPPAHLVELAERKRKPLRSKASMEEQSRRSKFPAEDMELLSNPEWKREGEPVERPEIVRDFGDLPNELVGSCLSIWSFCSIFCETLALYPFTFDEFQTALSSSHPSFRNPVLSETFAALLLAVIPEQKLWKVPLPAYSEDASALVTIEQRLFTSLTAWLESLPEDESTRVQAWSSWRLGDDGPACKGADPTSILRLQGWEIVLFGCVRDLMPNSAEKYRLLCKVAGVDPALDLGSDDAPESLEEIFEIGFATFTGRERLYLLEFLMELLVDMTRTHSLIDAEAERIPVLKADRRNLLRDKRIFDQQNKASSSSSSSTSIMKTKLEDVEEEEDEYVAMVYEADELANAETSSSIADMDVDVSEVSIKSKEKKKFDETRKSKSDKKKEQKAREMALKDTVERERGFVTSINELDINLRVTQGRSRVTELGRDRYHNRYFYFDGCIPTSSANRLKRQYNISHLFDWGCGRLMVEDMGVGPEPERFVQGDLEERAAIQGFVEGKWGYYDEAEDVDQLMNWLDDRGDREKLLKTSLLRIYEPLKNSMVKRVTNLHQAIGRKATETDRKGGRGMRTRTVLTGDENAWDIYQDYANKWGRESE